MKINQSLRETYGGLVGTDGMPLNTTISDALLKIANGSIFKYRKDYIIAAKQSTDAVTAMYSTVALDAAPLSINIVSNAILQALSGAGNQIVIENKPLMTDSLVKTV